jgi:hypothetical protein
MWGTLPVSRYIMFACRNIENELLAALNDAGSDFPVFFIPRETHLVSNKLREYLQGAIDSLENVDFILLPMGRCGNGVLGLVSKNASLVLPRCNDCIDLLLSGSRLKPERPRYAYFLTDGWLGSPSSIDTEYSYSIHKYGDKTGEEIIRMIYQNYRYFTFVDTKSYDLEAAKEKIMPLVRTTGMEINRMEGPCGVLRKMARLELDDNFAVVPPGEPVSEAHFHFVFDI